MNRRASRKTPPATASPTRGAGLLAACAISAAGVVCLPRVARAQQEQPGAETLAHQRYLEGIEHYDAGRYAAALEEFRASYGLYASPNSRLYIARALRELGRLPEAVEEYDTTLAESAERARSDPRYAETRDAAEREVRAIEGRVARLRLVVTGAPRWVRVRVGERVVPPAAVGMYLALAPGEARVSVEAEGYATSERTVHLAAGTRSTVQVPMGERRGGAGGEAGHSGFVSLGNYLVHGGGAARTAGLAVAGVGAVGLVAGAAFALGAQDTYAELSRRCGGGQCPEAERGTVARGRTLQTLTNVSLGVGAAGLAAGAGLLLWGWRSERPPPVVLSVTPDAVSVVGTF